MYLDVWFDCTTGRESILFLQIRYRQCCDVIINHVFISWFILLILIHWIAIYSMHRVIQPLDNLGLISLPASGTSFSNTNRKWPVIVVSLNFSGVLWREKNWCVSEWKAVFTFLRLEYCIDVAFIKVLKTLKPGDILPTLLIFCLWLISLRSSRDETDELRSTDYHKYWWRQQKWRALSVFTRVSPGNVIKWQKLGLVKQNDHTPPLFPRFLKYTLKFSSNCCSFHTIT